MTKRIMSRLGLALLLALCLALACAACALAVEGNGGEIIDGASFAAALGGAATATGDATNGWVVTLTDDVQLRSALSVVSGSYTFKSDAAAHTLTRASGYTGSLIGVGTGTSLTLGDQQPGTSMLTLDGGAVWVKQGDETPTPAEGATCADMTIKAPLISNSGTLIMLDGVSVQNNIARQGAAVHSSGTFTMKGGTIRNNRTNKNTQHHEVGAVYIGSGSFLMEGGTISGNECIDGVSAVFGNPINISGGTITQNGGMIAVAGMYSATITGGTFTDNSGYALGGDITLSGGSFSGNGGAMGGRYNKSLPECSVKLSGNPTFATLTDYIFGTVTVTDALSSSGVSVKLSDYAAGRAVVSGTSTHTLTGTEAALFTLPNELGASLVMDQANNLLKLVYTEPIIVEVTAVLRPDYDGQPTAAGTDFDVAIYLDVEGEKGEDITQNYTVGGGTVAVAFAWVSAGGADWTTGLPTEPGRYQVRVEVGADNLNYRSSGGATFPIRVVAVLGDAEVTTGGAISARYHGEMGDLLLAALYENGRMVEVVPLAAQETPDLFAGQFAEYDASHSWQVFALDGYTLRPCCASVDASPDK